jgi:hypothetical protein
VIDSAFRDRALKRTFIATLISATTLASITGAWSAPQLKKIDTTAIALTTSPRAHAVNQERIAIVDRDIEILDLSGSSLITLPALASKQLFSDVKKFKTGFLIAGVVESSTASTLEIEPGTINPDSVDLKSESGSSNGMTRLLLRQISSEGEIIRDLFFESDFPLLARSLTVLQDRAVIVGERATLAGVEGFFAEFNLAEDLPQEVPLVRFLSIGKVSTQIYAASSPRMLYGASREKIGTSQVQSLQDGVIIFLNNNLAVSKVVRSFQRKSARLWSGVNGSNLAVGTLLEGSKSTVTITKFNKSGNPQWTVRIPGARSPVISEEVVGFVGKGSFLQLPSLKSQSALFLTFDKKGVVKSALTTPALRIRGIADGYALIQLRSGAYQLIPLPNTK